MDEGLQKFLAKTRALVEIERAKQELWFSEAVKDCKTQNDFDQTLVRYVLAVFIAHAQALLDTGCEMNWSVAEIREQIKQTISDVTDEAYALKHQHGQSTDRYYFRPGFRRKAFGAVMASQEWREIQENLKTLAERQAETGIVQKQSLAPSTSDSRSYIERSIRTYGRAREQIEYENALDKMREPQTQAEATGAGVNTTPALDAIPQPNPETIGEQIERLRQECDLTIEELAEKVRIDPTNVSRHIRRKATPSRANQRSYERIFSKLLNRKIVIRKTQPQRS